MTWRGIAAFRLVTADLDRAARFYAALEFTLEPRQPIAADELALLGLEGRGERQPMRLGPNQLDLDCYTPSGRGYPASADAAALLFQHLALVTDNAAAAWEVASRAGAQPISREGPVTLPASAGGVTAVKFRDPDGHPLELLQFPDGAAHGWPGSGILGIDHSAVSISEAARSLRFYRAQGLVERDPSLNHGPTQVALDGLDGVEVDVMPLWPASAPPHLELLGYRQPRGRPHGPLAANDIAATRLTWHAGHDGLVRDPDGHFHQLQRG